MEDVRTLVTGIRDNLSQHSISQKDEVRVMKAMLNDRNYNVVTYGNNGPDGTLCPAQNARDLAANIISGGANIPKPEAVQLAGNYEFNNNDAQNMINISKEFVNTYTDTERKMSFGGRENYEMSILKYNVPQTEKSYPRKVVDAAGNPVIGDDGKQLFEHPTKIVPAHTTARMMASCPQWLYK